MNACAEQLLHDQRALYGDVDFPALLAQFEEWKQSQPLRGKKILDVTPCFQNTFCKYANLLVAGADLTVSCALGTVFDSAMIPRLAQYGIKYTDSLSLDERYDVILDCAGLYANLQNPPVFGAVELTRTGIYHYEQSKIPVYLADESRIKMIETCLGTGESFVRAMHFLNYDLAGKNVVVFGHGKVGRGVALYAERAGANVIVVDDATRVQVSPSMQFIDYRNKDAIDAMLASAHFAVSVTGKKHALRGCFDAQKLVQSKVVIANMGVEDEWGPEVPNERVLNHKMPLNFMMDEPTLLRYIDPTLALHNYGAVKLITQTDAQGIIIPSEAEQKPILDAVLACGILNEEISLL